MVSIQDALSFISLEMYSEAFNNAGFSTLETFLNASPQELEKTLNDLAMLKGHTFKFKKMIEEAKAGNLPKARNSVLPGSTASVSNISTGLLNDLIPPKVNGNIIPRNPQEGLLQSCPGIPSKEVMSKVKALQGQLDFILRFKESVVRSLQEFVSFDFAGFLESLNSLKNIQDSVNGVLTEDVEMS